MGLLRKMRILVGALVHRPFMPRPEKVQQEGAKETHPTAGAQVSQEIGAERVADLISARRADPAEEAGKTGSIPDSRERDLSS